MQDFTAKVNSQFPVKYTYSNFQNFYSILQVIEQKQIEKKERIMSGIDETHEFDEFGKLFVVNISSLNLQ